MKYYCLESGEIKWLNHPLYVVHFRYDVIDAVYVDYFTVVAYDIEYNKEKKRISFCLKEKFDDSKYFPTIRFMTVTTKENNDYWWYWGDSIKELTDYTFNGYDAVLVWKQEGFDE